MPEGRIRWFNHYLGAGFISTEEGENVFFCTGVVQTGNSNVIHAGQHVTFDILKKKNGISPSAANVKIS